ncbi:hypothetical protein CWE09_08660 [Aliidiomarina minuta]|uniref:Uncharacterized protein n=1 Tax=Aliidiomarina minuta TaxID=880057 RepID=A0A432W9M3_9GAMM|nr:hypothetical protein [Aliidiomarina minuta]RUO26751.1 hypothetical protein CWE09_08660 [Aliidiomarina minuta]
MRGIGVLLLVWLLTACAAQSQHSSRMVVDWEKVQQVEAGRGGPSSIIWLNYPRKQVPVDDTENES